MTGFIIFLYFLYIYFVFLKIYKNPYLVLWEPQKGNNFLCFW